MMKGIGKIKNKMRRKNKISNVKTQSSNEKRAMSNAKAQINVKDFCFDTKPPAEGKKFDI